MMVDYMLEGEDKELYVKALEKWGVNAQLFQFYEEIGELMQVLSKFQRANCDIPKEKVLYEIADVEIMLGQLKIIFGDDKFGEIKLKKLRKLEKYLND